jgi:hypothetical protein
VPPYQFLFFAYVALFRIAQQLLSLPPPRQRTWLPKSLSGQAIATAVLRRNPQSNLKPIGRESSETLLSNLSRLSAGDLRHIICGTAIDGPQGFPTETIREIGCN